ncbi:unnamed protein product [Rotaria sp. Silwood1]|nr:unnamed protein product [Rotaria sp. Silwood1]
MLSMKLLLCKLFDSHSSPITNDEPVETYQMNSSQHVNIDNDQNVQLKEKTISGTSADVIDIYHSCQNPSAQLKL